MRWPATSRNTKRERHPLRAGSGNPTAATYQCFRARDGYVLIAAPSQRRWQAVVRVLDAAPLLDDPRFRSVAERSRNLAAL